MIRRRTSYKLERMDQEFIRELNVILEDVKDPRVDALTSIVDIHLSKDLSFVRAYVQTSAEDKKKVIEGLKSAKPFIKMKLVLNLNLRKAPEIDFKIDDTIENAKHIEELLRRINGREEEN